MRWEHAKSIQTSRLPGEIRREVNESKHELDSVQVQQGLEFTIKTLQMFEFGSLQAAMSRGGNAPTTKKWVDRTKTDDGNIARCWLVVRDFKRQREEPRDDLFLVVLEKRLNVKTTVWDYIFKFSISQKKGM